MFKKSRRYVLLLIMLLGTQAIKVHAWEVDQISTVTSIVDGDSFHITGDDVRLADVNAPEWNQPGGSQATDALTRLISGRTVYLDTDDKSGKDQYGRLIAVVYVAYNSTHYLNVNKELLLNGVVVIDDFNNNEFDPSAWTLFVRYSSPTPSTILPGNLVMILIGLVLVGIASIYLRIRDTRARDRNSLS